MNHLHLGRYPLSTLRRWCLYVAAAWGVLAILSWIFAAQQFYRSYLFAWLFWLGISLGSMGVVMMHHLIGGRWGIGTRRFGEHAAMCLPVLVVLFIPIAIGVPWLYEWARPDKVRTDVLLQHKQPYLNYGFFLIRAVIYLAIWLWMAWTLRRNSLHLDRTADPVAARRVYDLSAVGEVVLFVTMSFAALDWIMSRDAHWISTVFGLVVVCGQGISGLCFMILMMALLRDQEPLRSTVERDHFNDLGNVLLTFVILWTYMAFAQLLVIWMGNKQEEITWYVARLSNGWWWIGLIILLLHFLVPFIVLLMRDAKRVPDLMLWLCAGLLLMRAIDVFWMVAPSGGPPKPLLHHVLSWMDFVFPVGMGGLWFAFFLWLMEGHPVRIEDRTIPNAELRDTQS